MTPFLHNERIRILFFSDVHESIHENIVQSIFKKLLENYPSDYIFIGGDLGSVLHKSDYEKESVSAERNELLYENLFLNEVSQLNIPILWIPGNHDSASAFNTENIDKSRNVFNLHNRIMEIAPNLFVLGVGGSAPAYNRNGELIWEGYPNLTKDIVIDEAMCCAETIPNSASVILLSHCPPSVAPSSHILLPQKNRDLYAGSQSLTTLFNTLSSTLTIPLYLHGHCHNNLASNIVYIEKQETIVCSSGAFRDSFFIHVEMEYKRDKWRVYKQNLCILPNDDD